MLDLWSACFFFQLLYNIPSLTLYVWNTVAAAEISHVTIAYQPLQATNLKMVGVPSDLELYARISVCHANLNDHLIYEWKIQPDNAPAYESTSFNCSFIFQTTHYNSLHVAVNIRNWNGTLLAKGGKNIHLEKRWIAVIGDSFASGEGNPDVSGTTVQWQNADCHRSRKSFAFQVAQTLANNSQNETHQLSFLACSGATATDLIDGPTSQLSVLERIANERKSGPDLVLLTIGANDIGFSDILQALSNRFRTFDYFESRFLELSLELDRIAARLSQMEVARVVLPLYYDITRNENGQIDATCGAFGKVKTIRLAQAEKKLMKKLNELLKRKAEKYNWTAVEQIPSLFYTRGVCSSERLVISPEDSIRTQQSLRGAFHPNEEGHRLIANEILKLIL